MTIYHYVYGKSSAEWQELYVPPELVKTPTFRDQLKHASGVEGDLPADVTRLRYYWTERKGQRCWVLIHTCAATDHRPGAHVSHCLIGRFQDLSFLPIELWKWPSWVRKTQPDLDIVDPAIADSKPIRESFQRIVDGSGGQSLDKLAELLDRFCQLLKSASPRGPLLLTGQESEQVATWIGLLSLCLPEDLVQRSLTFSTYETAVSARLWLHGHRNGEEVQGVTGHTPRIKLADPTTEPSQPELWTRFCVECLKKPEKLGWPAVEFARNLYAFADGDNLLERLNFCADTAHWVFEDRKADSPSSLSVDSVFDAIHWNHQHLVAQRVELLVDFQKAIWPERDVPSADHTGCFDRDSKSWLDVAVKWVNSPTSAAKIQCLRHSYLSILENYWTGDSSLEHVSNLETERLDAESRDRIFALCSQALRSTERVDPFFKAIQISLSIGHEEKLRSYLETPELQGRLRSLSHQKAFRTRIKGLRSPLIRAAIERVLSRENSLPGQPSGTALAQQGESYPTSSNGGPEGSSTAPDAEPPAPENRTPDPVPRSSAASIDPETTVPPVAAAMIQSTFGGEASVEHSSQLDPGQPEDGGRDRKLGQEDRSPPEAQIGDLAHNPENYPESFGPPDPPADTLGAGSPQPSEAPSPDPVNLSSPTAIDPKATLAPTVDFPAGVGGDKDCAPLGIEALQDPRLLPKLAVEIGVETAKIDGKRMEQELWRIAETNLPEPDTETPEDLFDVYYWTLWQVQQNQRLLSEPKHLVTKILLDIEKRRRYRASVRIMLRQALRNRKSSKAFDSWLGQLFKEGTVVERLLEFFLRRY